MKLQKLQGGFTIVEVMLFLAISTLMTITLLVGWGIAVNTQAYKDASRSLSSYLQSEYTSTSNVSNSRAANYKCGAAGGSIQLQQASVGTQSRGASECVIMGRYLLFDGVSVKSSTILGIQPTTAPTLADSDVVAIKSFLPRTFDDSILPSSSYDIPYIQTTYTSSSDPTVIHMAMIIIRSPVSGTVYTYWKNITGIAPTVNEVVDSANTTKKTICLNPGSPVAQPRTAVVIAANASSGGAISTSTEAGC